MTNNKSKQSTSQHHSCRHDSKNASSSLSDQDSGRILRIDAPVIAPNPEWELVFDALPDPTAIMDTQYRIVWVNKSMSDRLGLSRDQCVGQKCFKCFHDTDEPPAFCPLSQLLGDGLEHEVEIHDQNLAGDFHLRVSPLRNSSGALIGSVHVVRDITEHKQNEKQILEDTQVLRTLLDAIPESAFLTDRKYRFLIANKELAKRFGTTPEKLVGESITKPLPPGIGRSHLHFLAEAFETGRIVRFNDTRAGSNYAHIVAPVANPSGQIELVAVLGIDETGRIQSEQQAMNKLTKSEERYRKLFTSMEAAFAVHEIIRDASGMPCDYRFLEVNPAFERHTGLAARKLVGRTVLEALPGTENSWIDRYGHVVDTGNPTQFEAYSRELDRWYDVLAYRPQPEQFAVIFSDITKRKQTEQELREAILRQQEAVKAGKVGLWDWNLDTDKVQYSREWKRQIGYEEHEISDSLEEWKSRVHPEDLEPALQKFQRSVEEKKLEYSTEFRFRHKDGSYRWILVQASFHQNKNGRIVRMLGSHLDITERKRTQEKLLAAERLRAETEKIAATGRMAVHVAHEINNPLAGIVNSFHLIKSNLPEEHPDHDLIEIIDRELERIASVVKQMYELNSQNPSSISEVSVDMALKDVLIMLEPLSREKNIKIELNDVTAGCKVSLPEGGLHQVLYNLIANAIEASPVGNVVEIHVHLKCELNSVVIECRDHGCGIPEDQQEQIFDPFFTTKKHEQSEQGMGLGLSIIKGIVDAADGTIDFESKINKGTIFYVRLPISQKEKES